MVSESVSNKPCRSMKKKPEVISTKSSADSDVSTQKRKKNLKTSQTEQDVSTQKRKKKLKTSQTEEDIPNQRPELKSKKRIKNSQPDVSTADKDVIPNQKPDLKSKKRSKNSQPDVSTADKDDLKQTKKIKTSQPQGSCDNLKSIKLRSSPAQLCIAMSSKLNSIQQQALRDFGFGSLIGFNIQFLPGKLVYYVVDHFDPENMVIKTSMGDISCDRDAVHAVFGIPKGEKDIHDYPLNEHSDIVKEWDGQWPSDHTVRNSSIVAKIDESSVADNIFKMNILMLFTNTMVTSATSGVLCKEVLNRVPVDADLRSIDWCGYLLSSLKVSKSKWDRENPEKNPYSGPATFLTLLYVDRTKCESIPVIRECPIFKNWAGLLSGREKKEVSMGGFGLLELLPPLDVKNEEKVASEGFVVIDDVKKCKFDSKEDCYNLVAEKIKEALSVKSFLITTVKDGLSKFPGDQTLNDFYSQICDIYSLKADVDEEVKHEFESVVAGVIGDLDKVELEFSQDDDLNLEGVKLDSEKIFDDVIQGDVNLASDEVSPLCYNSVNIIDDNAQNKSNSEVKSIDDEQVVAAEAIVDLKRIAVDDKVKSNVSVEGEVECNEKELADDVEVECNENVGEDGSEKKEVADDGDVEFNKNVGEYGSEKKEVADDGEVQCNYKVDLDVCEVGNEKEVANDVEVEFNENVAKDGSEKKDVANDVEVECNENTLEDGTEKKEVGDESIKDPVEVAVVADENMEVDVEAECDVADQNLKVAGEVQCNDNVVNDAINEISVQDELDCLSQWYETNAEEIIRTCDLAALQYKISKSASTSKDKKQMVLKNDDAPSFNLGLTQTPPNISQPSTDLFSSPKALAPVFEKRPIKPSAVLRSPYVNHKSVVSERLSAYEYAVANHLFSCIGSKLEVVFESKEGVTAARITMESLCPNIKIDASVINIWSFLLNFEEKSRKVHSVHRVFLPTSVLLSDICIDKKQIQKDKVWDHFREEMDLLFANFILSSDINAAELIFIPVCKNDHFFVLVFDLRKKPALVILDNIYAGPKFVSTYTRVCNYAKTLIGRFLHGFQHPAAEFIKDLKPHALKVKWMTEYNVVDCGVFAMRHMETYMGENEEKWDCELPKECAEQNVKLRRLRNRYAARIMTHPMNSYAESNMQRAIDFLKEYDKEEIKQLVILGIKNREQREC